MNRVSLKIEADRLIQLLSKNDTSEAGCARLGECLREIVTIAADGGVCASGLSESLMSMLHEIVRQRGSDCPDAMILTIVGNGPAGVAARFADSDAVSAALVRRAAQAVTETADAIEICARAHQHN